MLGVFASVVALSAASCAASFLPSPSDLFPRVDLGELVPRASSSSNFSLFAYGSASDTEIGGYPLFYYDGMSRERTRSVLRKTSATVQRG